MSLQPNFASFKVIAEWLMDQVPLGDKAPRRGLARLIHCPACRGMVLTPVTLNSSHVLLDCMAVEGAGEKNVVYRVTNFLNQELGWGRGSATSWTCAPKQAGAENRPTFCTWTEWTTAATRSTLKSTCRGVPASKGSPKCGSTLGGRRRSFSSIVIFNFPPGYALNVPPWNSFFAYQTLDCRIEQLETIHFWGSLMRRPPNVLWLTPFPGITIEKGKLILFSKNILSFANYPSIFW